MSFDKDVTARTTTPFSVTESYSKMKPAAGTAMKKLKWHHWLLLLTFLVAVIVTGLFGVRAIRRAIYWHNHQDEPIRSWMSVRYVAHSYRVPPHVLYKAIGLQPIPHDRRPLREIAIEQNRPVEALISELQDAIIHSRPPYPPPPPPDGGPP